MSESPEEILRRARPIPTYTDRPATRPHDVEGVDPSGNPCRVPVTAQTKPVLLLFLSADCQGCRELWEGLTDLHVGLAGDCRLTVVTKSPGEENEAAIADLSRGAPPEVEVVMSTPAYRDYRVGGPPLFVLAGRNAVVTEGVAWGLVETLRAARTGLEGGE